MFGKIINHNIKENKIEFNFENGLGIIEVLNPKVINVFSPIKYDDHYSRAIEKLEVCNCNIEVSKCNIKINKVNENVNNENSQKEFIEIKTEELIIHVFENFIVDFYDNKGNMLCQDYRGERAPFIRRGTVSIAEAEGHKALKNNENHKIEVIKKMFGDEKFYGLGDKTGQLNKKGYEYEMWNTDDPSPHVESHKALYKSIPFFITLRDESAYGLFFDNTFKTYFDMAKENSEYYYFGADDGNLDYYFIAGPQIQDVITGYTKLTGRTPLPQMWTLGYQQSRWSYAPESRVMEIAKGFRNLDIPLDAIHLDIDYMDGFRVFTWDKERFENPAKFLEGLKNDGVKIVTIIDPGVKKDRGYSVYEEGLKNNYYATDKDGIPYVNAVWPGDSVYPDFSNKDTRKWWSENQKIMIDCGVSGIWNDMNEPASFNGPLPDDVCFKNDGRPSNHTEIHNVYGHLMSKATYVGIKKYTNKRPFVITRACYAGSQKYSTVWTGDNQSFWEHLRLSIPMLLNLGMSGMAFCGCDVGGFTFDTTPELLSRWVQVACFSPLFRNHSAVGTRDQEPWAFDEATLNINRKYIKLRYKLIPYMYDLMWQCENNGLPPMRALIMHYSNDKNVHNLNDEFLVGENILAAPVVEQGKDYRAVYIPEGKWFDYWTNEIIDGKNTIIKEAPLDICPIYIKSGSIIPNYPSQNYIGEKKIDELILDIYEGMGEYIHYQDDGESFKYKDGEYNLYKFTQVIQSPDFKGVNEENDTNNVKEINKEVNEKACKKAAAFNDKEVYENFDRCIKTEIYIEKLQNGFKNAYKSFNIKYNNSLINKVLFNGLDIDFTVNDNHIEFTIPAENGKIELL